MFIELTMVVAATGETTRAFINPAHIAYVQETDGSMGWNGNARVALSGSTLLVAESCGEVMGLIERMDHIVSAPKAA